MKKCIHAYTEPSGALPAYANLSYDEESGQYELIVRSRGESAASSIKLEAPQVRDLDRDISLHLLASSVSRISDLEGLLAATRAIAEREGEGTAWGVLNERLQRAGIGVGTANTFKAQPGEN